MHMLSDKRNDEHIGLQALQTRYLHFYEQIYEELELVMLRNYLLKQQQHKRLTQKEIWKKCTMRLLIMSHRIETSTKKH